MIKNIETNIFQEVLYYFFVEQKIILEKQTKNMLEDIAPIILSDTENQTLTIIITKKRSFKVLWIIFQIFCIIFLVFSLLELPALIIPPCVFSNRLEQTVFEEPFIDEFPDSSREYFPEQIQETYVQSNFQERLYFYEELEKRRTK